MDLQLNETLAIVVGGAQGIGLGIGTAFAHEGADVILADINEKVIESAAQLQATSAATVEGLVWDATDYERTRQAAAEITVRFPGTQHLVYAAGCGSGKIGFPFWNLNPDDWPRVINANLMGAVNAAHAFTPHMVARRAGTMLFLSSVAGQIGSPTDPPYSAAKAAVINFAQCAAQDLAEYDVRVNVLCPGMVKTAVNQAVWRSWNEARPESTRQTYEAWGADKVKRLAPLGRWQTPADMAAMAVFLASDRAKNITGQTLNVDGGQVMHW